MYAVVAYYQGNPQPGLLDGHSQCRGQIIGAGVEDGSDVSAQYEIRQPLLPSLQLHHLADFLLQCHPGQEVLGPFPLGQGRILVRHTPDRTLIFGFHLCHSCSFSSLILIHISVSVLIDRSGVEPSGRRSPRVH